MRVLHVGKYFPPAPGGMERFVADLAHAQRAAGHDVRVLVHAHGGQAPAEDWVMRCPVRMKLLFAPISPAFPAWLARAVREHRPDVIHLHLPNPSAFWALALPAARRIPWVVHWHSDIEVSRPGLRIAYPHYRMFERALLEHAESIVATSPQYLAASKPLAAWRDKCRVVPLGVDPARLPAIDPSGAEALWGGPGLRLLAVGRLTYYKGFDTLLRAALACPGARLVVVGEGEERARLQRILDEAGNPDRIRLAGPAEDATMLRYMATCDAYCLPSRERTEAFGIVLMEAMRYGKPLVVSDLEGSGVRWVARPGQNAVVVPVDDVPAWSAAIESLAASPARRDLLGRLGAERYAREFDIAGVARQVDAVYRAARAAASGEDRPPAAGDLSDAPLEEDVAPSRAPAAGAGRLLIVIPALNEAACIGDVIRLAREQVETDVVVVDDGSTDETVATALLAGATVLRAPLWQGAWGALQTGIRYAVARGYAGVVTMDADGQHEPAHLPRLLEAARGADVVIAACPSRGSRLRHVAWSYFRFLTGFDFEDLTSGFRYYNAQACRLLAAEEATLLDYQDIGVLLLLNRARLRIAEIPVEMNPRRHGASRVFSSWWTVTRYMAETSLLCLARWNQSPRRRPPSPSSP